MQKLGYIGGQPDDDDSGQYRGNPPFGGTP